MGDTKVCIESGEKINNAEKRGTNLTHKSSIMKILNVFDSYQAEQEVIFQYMSCNCDNFQETKLGGNNNNNNIK